MNQNSISKSRPKSLFGNATWNFIGQIWAFAVSFLLTPFLILHIGSHNYGIFILIMSISSFLCVMNFGLGEATIRYVAYYYGRQDINGINRVVGATFSIFYIVVVLTLAVFFLSSSWLIKLFAVSLSEYGLSIGLLQLAVMIFAVEIFRQIFSAIPNALQRYDITTKLSILQSIIQVTGFVIIVLNGLSIVHLIAWYLVTVLLTLLVQIIVAKRLIPELRMRPHFSRSGLKEVLSFGIFSLIIYIFYIIQSQTDRLLLGTLVSASAVAYFTVPQNIATRASGLVETMRSVLFSRFSSLTDSNEIKKLYLDLSWALLSATIIICVPLTVLIPDFLRLWISQEFSLKSAWIGQIIAFSCIFRGAAIPLDSLLKGIGKPQYISLLIIATSVTSLILNLILIPIYGLAGAGYAFLSTIFWPYLLIIYTWKRILGMESLRSLFNVMVLPILCGIVSLILCLITMSWIKDPNWIEFIFLGSLFLSITFALVIGAEWLLAGRQSRAHQFLVYFIHVISSRQRTRFSK